MQVTVTVLEHESQQQEKEKSGKNLDPPSLDSSSIRCLGTRKTHLILVPNSSSEFGVMFSFKLLTFQLLMLFMVNL